MPFKTSSKGAGKPPRIVRRKLADGTIKEYRYAKRQSEPRYPAKSLGSLEVAWRASPQWAALAPHTKEVYSIYLRDVGRLQMVEAASLKRKEVIGLRNAIATKRGNGAGTGFMRALSAMLAWGLDNDWIEHSPAHRIKPLPKGTLRAWTAAQADQALANLPEEYRRVVVLAMHTAQRRGDLCRLTWAAYDGATIRLVQQKTGEGVAIPVSPQLRAEMDAWKVGRTATTILTTKQGLPWQPQHLSHMLPGALRAIGMPTGLNVHGLRKLAATRLAEAGCSMHEIAAITGHRTLSMVAHYTRSVDQEKLAGAAILRLSKTGKKTAKALK